MGEYDVAVVGASIAGCTAATLLAQAGLTVALIERRSAELAFKALCTHHVMACATPTIDRLGLIGAIEAAGGVRNGLDGYTPWGWVRSPAGMPHGYSIRREVLDPMLRRLTAGTPGVDLLLGERVTDVIAGERGVGGVRVQASDRRERSIRARLVVGADGAHSTVAELVGSERRVAPNERFAYFAEFTGVQMMPGASTQLWLHEAGVSYAMRNDAGVTVLMCMPPKSDLVKFQADREAGLLAVIRELPDGPDLAGAKRVSKVIGTIDYPLIRRRAVPAEGVALIGDAALTSDPSQGVGCGWAFQSAEWLADAVSSALLDRSALGPALRRYERARRVVDQHQDVIEAEARLKPPTAIDRLLLTAAVQDEVLAGRLMRYFNRTISPRQLLAPTALARAAWVNVGARRRIRRAEVVSLSRSPGR